MDSIKDIENVLFQLKQLANDTSTTIRVFQQKIEKMKEELVKLDWEYRTDDYGLITILSPIKRSEYERQQQED